MENQIEKFDPSKLMEGVRDRIKATFVSLIPDDKWEELVKVEVNKFFSEPRKDHWGNPIREYTEFASIVREEITKECRKRIAGYLESPEFAEIWDGKGKPVVTETVKKLIIDNAGEMLVGLMSQPVMDVIRVMKDTMNNPNRY